MSQSLVVLMIEVEQPEGLSARKLVVETAKHNVITAYSAQAGIELLRRFPHVDAVVVHSAVLERNEDLLSRVREITPHVKILLTHPPNHPVIRGADHVIDSHNPQELLRILQTQIVPRLEL